MAVALTRGFALSDSAALSVLVDVYNPKCVPPWTQRELEHKIKAARGKSIDQADGYLLGESAKGSRDFGGGSRVAAPAPAPKPVFVPDSLRRVSDHLLGTVTRQWLGDRSPVAPHTVSAELFLRAMLEPGESVVVVEQNFKDKGTYIVTRPAGDLMPGVEVRCCGNRYDRELQNWQLVRGSRYGRFPNRGCEKGFWWLPQPVNGVPTQNASGKWSWRSENNVRRWRWMVLESDVVGFERHWVAVLAQLPVPIGAIYSSGGRSVHALVRVDADSKPDWDEKKAEMAATFVELGADPAALSAVRLTRLPQMYRGKRLQALHWLDPDCDDVPIVDRRPVRSVRAEVAGSAKMMEFYRIDREARG